MKSDGLKIFSQLLSHNDTQFELALLVESRLEKATH